MQAGFFLLLLRPFLAIFFGTRVRGREHLPAREPFILVANHSSHLDTASLLNLFPVSRLRHIRACAAADYFERTRAISFLSHTLFNILSIHRERRDGAEDAVQCMRDAIERGESIVLFPEGTRGRGGEIAAFKSGVARLIEQLPGVPVVPVYLGNMGRALPRGESVPVPFICEVRIGAPLRLSGSRDEILEILRGEIERLRDEP